MTKWKSMLLPFLCFTLSLVLIPGAASGRVQGLRSLLKPAIDDYYNSSIGNLGVFVTNYGLIGDYMVIDASMEWPAGSANLYLFEGRIWFGAMVDGAKYVNSAHTLGANIEWGPSKDDADTVKVITGDEAVSELDTYCIYTDGTDENAERAMGIKVIQRTYTWSISYLDDFIIYDLTFINEGGKDLQDVYIGFCMDCDVSSAEGAECYIDDLTSYDPVNKISYMYDADNPEIPGDDTGGPNGESRGYIGTMPLLSPPAKDGRAGPNEPSCHYWWDWNHDPGDDETGYDYMASGRFLDTPPSPFDYRYLQAYGPYDLPAGGSIRIITVTGVGEGLVGLQNNLLSAKQLFEANKDRLESEEKWIASGPPPSPNLVVKAGDRVVTLEWDDSPEGHVDPVTNVEDFEGYRVWKSSTGVAGEWTLLADFDKINSVGLNSGLPPKNAAGKYYFIDRDVHNGYPYYYSVTSYDNGDLALAGILESSQVTNRTYVSPSALPNVDPDRIYVYPNPYKVQAPWDFHPDRYNPSEERVRFNNIPAKCTIRIYSLSGDLIKTIEHDSGTGSEDWDLISDNVQKIVSGVYIYNVKGEGVDYTGKFVVIR